MLTLKQIEKVSRLMDQTDEYARRESLRRTQVSGMRVIIAGGREVEVSDGVKMVERAIIESGFNPITELINGGATGIDAAARKYWHDRFDNKPPEYPLRTILAQWGKLGKSAGPIRNREMASNADALIAIWDGESRGTKNMIETAKEMGLKVYVHRYKVPGVVNE